MLEFITRLLPFLWPNSHPAVCTLLLLSHAAPGLKLKGEHSSTAHGAGGEIPVRTLVLSSAHRRVTLQCPVSKVCDNRTQLTSTFNSGVTKDQSLPKKRLCKPRAQWTLKRNADAPKPVEEILSADDFVLKRKRLKVTTFRRSYSGLFSCCVNGVVLRQYHVTMPKAIDGVSASADDVKVKKDTESRRTTDPTISPATTVDIHTGLRFITAPPQAILRRRGTTVELHCQAVGVPMPTITWQRGYAVMKPGQRSDRVHITANGTLVVRSLEQGDADTYRCVAENSYDMLVARSQVFVRW